MSTAPLERGEAATATSSARPLWAAPVAASCLAALLWLARAYLVGPRLTFLWWNLALAWAPYLMSTAYVRCRLLGLQVPVGLAWLVFFPNAPYLVTDLVHLRERAPVPLWLDALVWAAFALAGCVLGWSSLDAMARHTEHRLGALRTRLLVAVVVTLSGFGIYLGRFLRWNSWDVVTDPLGLFQSAARAACQPRALFFSLACAGFVGVGYLLVAPRFSPPEKRVEYARSSAQ